jgi:hypothetical protein
MMSIYREPGRRRARAAVAAGLVGILAGGLAGFLLGRGSADEPTLTEQVTDLEERLMPALSALELVTIEYAEGVRDGRVVAETEYDAAATQAETAASIVEAEREDLEALSPGGTARLDRELDELRELIEERATPAEVEGVAGLAERSIRETAGIQP